MFEFTFTSSVFNIQANTFCVLFLDVQTISRQARDSDACVIYKKNGGLIKEVFITFFNVLPNGVEDNQIPILA